MESRVAIVTGAGNGLGAAFAPAIAAGGAAVVVNNRRHADRAFLTQVVADAIMAAGGAAIAAGHAVDAAETGAAIVATALEPPLCRHRHDRAGPPGRSCNGTSRGGERAMQSAVARLDLTAFDTLSAIPNAVDFAGGEAALADFHKRIAT